MAHFPLETLCMFQDGTNFSLHHAAQLGLTASRHATAVLEADQAVVCMSNAGEEPIALSEALADNLTSPALNLGHGKSGRSLVKAKSCRRPLSSAPKVDQPRKYHHARYA
jgi:hypothetical protein